MFDYEEYASDAARVLDQCDFSDDIDVCLQYGYSNAYDILQHFLNYSYYVVGNAEVEEALENLTLDEFMEYLSDRYDVHIGYMMNVVM